MIFNDIGIQVPRVLIPRPDTDLNLWAVIACDQYTSQPDYWKKVRKLVGNSPSTLHLIMPEIDLDAPERDRRIRNIHKTMQHYLDKELYLTLNPGFILVDRATPHATSRKGLIVGLDLECYDYREGAKSLARSTEGTIMDRLPPRIEIRKHAPIELPHIMVLIDDPGKTVIEPLFDQDPEKIYDFDLMMHGGHITGYHVDKRKLIEQIATNLRHLANTTTFNNKYGLAGKPPMLYAMGDGNHSFATAKVLWDQIKQEINDPELLKNHPARFAMVELVNIHDEGLSFEPIHRVLFDVNKQDVLERMRDFFTAQGTGFELETLDPGAALERLTPSSPNDSIQRIEFITSDCNGLIRLRNPKLSLEVASLQDFLDTTLPQARIDYIHGKDVLLELGSFQDNIGFCLPPVPKHNFFRSIITDGALPRKTFSMGEADEKRFYLEGRRIVSG